MQFLTTDLDVYFSLLGLYIKQDLSTTLESDLNDYELRFDRILVENKKSIHRMKTLNQKQWKSIISSRFNTMISDLFFTR